MEDESHMAYAQNGEPRRRWGRKLSFVDGILPIMLILFRCQTANMKTYAIQDLRVVIIDICHRRPPTDCYTVVREMED